MKRATFIALLALSIASCSGAAQKKATPSAPTGPVAAPPAKPIIAVFDIETQAVNVPPDTLERLSGFLTVVIIEAGAFRVIPRQQVRARLRNQKKESYKSCYDQACQIEIGRELAATKALAARLVRLGRGCTVTGTLYDLKSATAEAGARELGRCTEADVARMLTRVAAKISDVDPDTLSGGAAASKGPGGGGAHERHGQRSIKLDACTDCEFDVDQETDKEKRRRRQRELQRARRSRYRKKR